MSRWTHSVCDRCYTERSTVKEELPEHPVRMTIKNMEKCCACGEEHSSGIYIREEPGQMPCGGFGGYHGGD